MNFSKKNPGGLRPLYFLDFYDNVKNENKIAENDVRRKVD
jgi:hypothetical protein